MDDPVENIGVDGAVKADAAILKHDRQNLMPDQFGILHPAPEWRTPDTPTPQVKQPAHSKVSHVRVEKEYHQAAADLIAAQATFVECQKAARAATLHEGHCLAEFLQLDHGPSPEELIRSYVEASHKARVERAGLPAEVAAPKKFASELDRQASLRPKHAARSGTPLRSNTVRR
jgi:hypothetical protein